MGAHYTTPQVKYGVLRYRTKNGRKTEFHEITVGSPAWFEWLRENRHFNVETHAGSFHARKEGRRDRFYWYGVKKIKGKVKKKYLGADAKLNNKTLHEAARELSQ